MLDNISPIPLANANKSLKWVGGDTEELYQYNLKNNYSLLQKYNWIDADITYDFNSQGFRSDEFSQDPGVLFLGCSHTIGAGLPLEDTWAYRVSNELKLKRFNLGFGGSSNDTAFRLGNYWIPKIKPVAVMFLSTYYPRAELHTANGIQHLGTWPHVATNDIYWQEYTTNDVNGNMNYLKNVLALKQICSEHNIKFLHKNFQDVDLKDYDLARDLLHRGVNTNQHIANTFLSMLAEG